MPPTVDLLHTEFLRFLGLPEPSAPGPAPAPDAPGPAASGVPDPAAPSCLRTDAAKRGWHLDVTVPPDRVVPAAEILDRHGFAMDAVTGVDWMAPGQIEIVYDFFHPRIDLRVVVRTRVPRDNGELPTISGVFPGANWHERETHDFFGVRFAGHPDLSPLLLPEDADYHPLRKDFAGAA